MNSLVFAFFVALSIFGTVTNISLRVLSSAAEPAIIIPTVISEGGELITATVGTNNSATVQTFNLDFVLGEYSYINSINCTDCTGNRFDPALSSSSQKGDRNLSVDFHSGMAGANINGTVYKDTINSTILSTFDNFVLAQFNNLGNTGAVAFPRDYTDDDKKNFSIFDQIMNQHKKNSKDKVRRVVSHKTISSTNGQFYLGDYPTELSNGELPFTKCSAGDRWNCKIKRLGFSNFDKKDDGLQIGNSSSSEDNVYFSFSFNEILAPAYTKDKFVSNYFAAPANDTNCSFFPVVGGIEKYVCNEDGYNRTVKKNIWLKLDEAAYRINISDAHFSRDNTTNNYTFFVRFVNTTDWTLGRLFLNNYIAVFDGDLKTISFYGADIKDFSSNTVPIVITIVVAAIIAVSAILFLICLCRKRDNEGYTSHE